jgi:hypothetical protein
MRRKLNAMIGLALTLLFVGTTAWAAEIAGKVG